MYTLKIKWYRYDFSEPGKAETADETTLFISADEVRVHGEVTSDDQMKAWESGEFQDYATRNNVDGDFVARLICVEKNNKSIWYLATHAWILGPNGSTIERVAP